MAAVALISVGVCVVGFVVDMVVVVVVVLMMVEVGVAVEVVKGCVGC